MAGLAVKGVWLCALLSVLAVLTSGAPSEGDVRLVDGPNPYEGRVEYFHDGVWLSLCRSYIDNEVPNVVCRQLGYPTEGAMMFYGGSYGPAPGETYRGRIYCSGNEASLSDCTITADEVNCNPSYATGISCDTNVTVTSNIRIVDGSDSHQGRLEVFQNGVWGTVCRLWSTSYMFTYINPHVACRELFGTGYGGSYFPTYETPSRFGLVLSGAIMKSYVKCDGDEDSLFDCAAGTPSYSCNHEDDATLDCFPVPDGCGGHLTGDTGTVQSPGYPDGQTFTRDTDCVWKITTSPNTLIRLSFADFTLDASQTSNYIQIVDYYGSGTRAYLRSTPTSDVSSTMNTMYIRHHTVEGSTGIKFSASWEAFYPCDQNYTSSSYYIRSPGYSQPYPPNMDCTYIIEQRPEYTIRFTFSGFGLDETEGGTCVDFITVYDGGSVSAPVLGGPYCGSTAPPELISTGNVAMVRFHSDDTTSSAARGFYISYRGLEPDPIVTQLPGDTGTFQSPGYPNLYDNETDYIWNITATKPYYVITLTFSDFNIVNCLSRLEIRDRYSSGPLLANPCGSGIPNPVTSESPVMYIRLISTPVYTSTSGSMFQVSWAIECRQTYSGSSGTIMSPEYNSTYPPNMDCIILISQDPGYYVMVNFTSFHLDLPVNGVCQDYIEVRDGSSEFSPLIGQYCGTSLPPSLSSTETSMWIRFYSDSVTDPNSIGYEATYQAVEKECDSQLMTAPEGNFSSPGFPLRYPADTYCIWTITVDPGDVIEMTFVEFSVGTRNRECYGAYVRLYDSVTVDVDTVIDTFCGDSEVPKITTRGNSLTVVLNSFSYSSATANGFRASYVSIDREEADVSQYDLFPYGFFVGDKRTQLLTESSMQEVYIQAGFPFGNEQQHLVYIGNNGIVSVGNEFSWPALPEDKMVVCAYCAHIDNTDSSGGIFYHLYGENPSDVGVLQKATREVREFSQSRDFTATLALVVTWDRVKQGRYSTVAFNPANEDGEATFQLALISDGLTSYVLVYYLTGAMEWEYRGRWSYVIMGHSDGRGDNYELNLYSKTRNAYDIDTITGNTGRKGIWIYKVGEVPAHPDFVCIKWFFRNLIVQDLADRFEGFSLLPRCPCSGRDVWRKMRYMWTWSRTDTTRKITCYRLNRAQSRHVYPYGKECCYSNDLSNQLTYEQLIMDPPFAGSALAHNPAIFALRQQYEAEDRQGHDACCLKSSHPLLCLFYYILRPIGQCRANIPFRFAWLWGDPHIMTLDEREYIFNGWGEYTLVTLDLNFTLQGRMGRLELEDGTPVNATVFTAFAAEENGTSVFVGLHPVTKDSLEIYVDDIDYSLRFQNEREDFLEDTDNFTMFRDNNSLVISFPSGISIAVAIGMRSLVMSLSMPPEFKSLTRGLLGNYNGAKDDDFVLPDGTVLSDDITDRQIHNQFGQQWAVTEDDTVFRYGPREGPADHAHPDFEPIFLDEVPAADRQTAESVCGASDLACIYDYIVTGSESFALATKELRDQALAENAQIKNSLPELEVPVNVSVTSGQPASFQVVANDPDDGDVVTYKLADDANGALSVDPSTGEVTANLNVQQQVDIRVYAVDSNSGQSVVRSVPVIMCSNCNGHGECDFTKARENVGTLGFRHAVCDCQAGWTGGDCELDNDACLENPCDPLQNCTDLTPAQEAVSNVGYTCSDCPQGYSMSADGSSQCLDVDECQDNTHNCDMQCDNTAGSFQCACSAGYRLSSDGHSCLDVNECAEKTDNCEQVCRNTVGGFQCLCEEGFTYDSVQNVCSQNQATADACQNSGCSQACGAVTNPSTNALVAECFCRPGYDLDPDGITCVDHDECDDGLCAQTCNNTDGGFSCSCYSGYQLNDDQRTCSPCPSLTYGPECRLNCSCSGRGLACHHVTGCVCQAGWTGSECKDDVDECAENPDVCGEGMVCRNNEGSYTCTCRPGYSMDNGMCTDVDECMAGTVCGEFENCTNTPGSFYCTCRQGFQSDNGTCIDIDECSASGGGCQQGCVNVDGSYNCECFYGYTLNTDRSTCAQASEPCASGNPCDHGCTLDDADSEICFCHIGYTLQADGHSCQDIDECTEGTSACSHTCNNTEGGFTCSCPIGMKLTNDGKTCQDCPSGTYGADCAQVCDCGPGAERCDVMTGCVCNTSWTGDTCSDDVNECQTEAGLQECQEKNAECFNFRGGYRCQCRDGFAPDGDGNCQDIDECTESPCGQQCENTPGSYRCLCSQGFSVDSETGDCKDIDECELSSTHSCKQTCHNLAGSYRCSCHLPGYTLDNDGASCTAQTSCTRSDCDESNGGCAVIEGKETCFCNTGYTLAADSVSCTLEQTDWCNEGACDQQCQVSDDGMTFTCSCDQGHLLNDDGRTCRACQEGTYGADCASTCACNIYNTESCDPVTGTCSCRPGWHGDSCADDVNECHQTTPVCDAPSTCQNTIGSYFCFCDAGYKKSSNGTCVECAAGTYGIDCAQMCSCPEENVESCDKVDGTCRCKAGWEGASCDVDVDECDAGTDDCSADDNLVCSNTDGSFSCVCMENYTRNEQGSCVECPTGTYGINCTQQCPCQGENVVSCHRVNGACPCKAGWEGVSCDVDVDECDAGTDDCSADDNLVCSNTDGSFSCVCMENYTRNEQGSCVECPTGTYGINCTQQCPCQGENVVSCHRVDGACPCKAGWEGANCDVDVDECDAGTDDCSADDNLVCSNTDGSFSCVCMENYTRNEQGSCAECPTGTYGINCTQRCPCQGENVVSCHRVNGACPCKAGWEGASCDVDVDECDAGTDDCSADDNLVCSNTDGSFSCVCMENYTRNEQGSCVECPTGTYGINCTQQCPCQGENVVSCHRVDGACPCKAGWEGTSCDVDVDECDAGTDDCSADDNLVCSNTDGSFGCVCMENYTRNEQGSCVECPTGTYGINCTQQCPCQGENVVSCHRVDGACPCKAGWEGTSCDVDVDECDAGTDDCSADDNLVCSNTDGSFSCVCMENYTRNEQGSCVECPTGTYGINCTQKCPCQGENVASCHQVDGACPCKAGWEGTSCDVDVDECETGSHDCSAGDNVVCENTAGSFICVCADNYGRKNIIDKCVATTRLKFKVTILVFFTGDLSTSSSEFFLVKTQTENVLFTRLSARVTDLFVIVITSIRRGSLIVEAEAVVDSSSVTSAAAALTSALVEMNGQNVTVANLTGPVGVTVGDVNVTADTTQCDVFLQFGLCDAEQTCDFVGGAPSCSSKETKESSLMWLVFGLAVGIPLAIVIVCIVSILCYRHHTREEKIHVNDQHRTGPALEEDYPDPDYSKPQNHSKMSDKVRPYHSSQYSGPPLKGNDNTAFSPMN